MDSCKIFGQVKPVNPTLTLKEKAIRYCFNCVCENWKDDAGRTVIRIGSNWYIKEVDELIYDEQAKKWIPA